MGTTLHDLQPPAGARKRKKRVGRGIGSGRGKTCGRGTKGQRARRQGKGAKFEGGQLPIHRRVPKRGFTNIHRVEVHGLNVGVLEKAFGANDEVTIEGLHARGLIPKNATVVKLLGDGELSFALKIQVHRSSDTARAKVENAGGQVTLLEMDGRSTQVDAQSVNADA